MSRFYVALFVKDGREVVSQEYRRAVVEFEITGDLQMVNSNKVVFATAACKWGRVVCAGIYKSPFGGTPIVMSRLKKPSDVNSLDSPSFKKGSIVITMQFDSMHLN